MKDFIKRRLREAISVPTLSLAKNIEVSDEDKEKIQALDWKDLNIDQTNEESPIQLKIELPVGDGMSDGIAVDLQIINDTLFQIHITLAPELRNLGLGFKIYKAIILTYGHLYSGKGRRHNVNEVPKIWAKLDSEPEISCRTTDKGSICVANAHPQKQDLLNYI